MKVGVLGCGYLGSRHARKLASRNDLDQVLLFDPLAGRADLLAREIGAEPAASAADLIARADAVIVAAPTALHAALTIEALAAGRPVLVEKPIAVTLEEADRMTAAATRAGRILVVGHSERFNPVVRALRGRIESPKFIEAHRLAAFQPRSLDIDVILDLMIHDIDLVLHFTGEAPARIEAAGTAVLTPKIDIANARLAFPGGCVANLTASRVSLSRTRKIRFFMPETYVSVDLNEGRAERYTRRPGDANPESFMERIDHETVNGLPGDALEAEQEAFLQAVRGDHPAIVTGVAGRQALAVALEILGRLRTGEI
jgi:predicted dehydrogenase